MCKTTGVAVCWGIIAALVYSNLFMTTGIVRAQAVEREIVPGTMEIDVATGEALRRAVQDADAGLPSELRYFAVTDIRKMDNVSVVSLVGMLDNREDWILERDGAWVGLAVVRGEGETVVGAVEGTAAFSEILSQIPEGVLSQRSKAALYPLQAPPGPQASTSPEIPRFPWETYYNMRYGSYGVHANGFLSGWKAVDFLSDGNTASGHAPNKLLASLSGTIDYVCRDETSVAIRIDNFFYSHLLDNANLSVGKGFAQGDTIGQLRSGDFNDRCGYADQPDGTFHVHWGFPNFDTLEIAGWTLDTAAQEWTNGSQTRSPNSWMYADPTYCTGHTPGANQVILYTGINYCGDYSILEIGSYPDAASVGLADNTITSARVGDGVTLIAYQNPSYTGTSEELYVSDFDLRDNPVGSDTISSVEVVSLVDLPPAVVSVLRADPDPTDAPTVTFTVTFSEPVTGVDTVPPFDDFILITSIADAAITSVSGSGATYHVVVDTGAGDGTIRLDVLDDDSIQDPSGSVLGDAGITNGNFTAGAVYSILRREIFGDVSRTYWAWDFIELLSESGITGGCATGPVRYCPETTVTRDQMAVFLLRGIHGSSYNPPSVGGSTGFGDVPTSYWAASWIKQMAAEGITGGCGFGNFCPTSAVTRAQMAVFLLKAKYGSSYSPPGVGGSTGFVDVPTSYWAGAWIKQLVAEGITSGCGAGTYCPETPVTRAQMAVFLVKTFNLP